MRKPAGRHSRQTLRNATATTTLVTSMPSVTAMPAAESSRSHGSTSHTVRLSADTAHASTAAPTG